jgi:hypothetical protein
MDRMKNKLVYLILKFIVSMESNCVRKLCIHLSSVLLSNTDGPTFTSESLNKLFSNMQQNKTTLILFIFTMIYCLVETACVRQSTEF